MKVRVSNSYITNDKSIYSSVYILIFSFSTADGKTMDSELRGGCQMEQRNLLVTYIILPPNLKPSYQSLVSTKKQLTTQRSYSSSSS
jgi:hypothetical protein